jgi:hypothetical protein
MGNVRFKVIEKDGQQIVQEIHKVVVHRFRMGDVEDPDLYAAQPILEWEKSDPGKFVMEHAIDTPEWRRNLDQVTYGYQYAIVAELEKKKLSEFYLRFDKTLTR